MSSYFDSENGNDKFFKDFSKVKDVKEGDTKSVISVFDQISPGYNLHMGEMNTVIQRQLVQLLSEQIQLDDSLNLKCSILDVGCGTGIVGQCLRQAGFTGTIEGVDGSQGMVDEANKLGNVYNKLYTEILQPEGNTPLPKHNYDVVISGHAFFPNYLTCDHLPLLLNYLHVGGLLIFNIQKPIITEKPNPMTSYYANINKKLDELVKQNRCKNLLVRDVVGKFPILKYFDSPDSKPTTGDTANDVQICLKKVDNQTT